MSDVTPMMLQYHRIKSENRDTVLFYRLGDFYEMFENDALEVSRILNITLTSRHGIPMCGIPYHASGNYIPRLLNAGKKIAICEQTSKPQKGKGIVDREVVEIITPGTVIDENYLRGNQNNYIVSIGRIGEFISFIYLDLSTAEFGATAIDFNERENKLKKELFSINPSELIIQESLLEEDSIIKRLVAEKPGLLINRYPDWKYDYDSSFLKITGQLGVSNLKAFGLTRKSPEIFAGAVLLEYIDSTSRSLLPHIQSLKVYSDSEYMGMDEATQKNLELLRNLHDNTENFSLISILDKTKTRMGSRKLKRWIVRPLTNINEIQVRHSTVEYFYHKQIILNSVRNQLKSVMDIERLSSKIAMDKANAKDLNALAHSLDSILQISEMLKELEHNSYNLYLNKEIIETVKFVIDKIINSISDEPSILLTEGRIIKKGYNKELDSLKKMKDNSHQYLKEYLETEKEKSGISNLKIKYNKIIGHFIEVTNSNLNIVPEHFIRRQTLVNNERYTTEKLGELESDLNSAAEKIISLEKELFIVIRNKIKEHIQIYFRVSSYISNIDCLQSFAQAATVYGYIKPEIFTNSKLEISEGRHPVVESNIGAGDFVPNSTVLENERKSFALITGPNMAGKSTYLRQVALIVLMAQSGSFIPANSAKIGITDKIFCRVGASDNLARGESTFLVEMNETAYILRNATENSLVIMDEVGRGTSTNDGLAIAWAISEYLLNLNIKTLFATHYHELTKIDDNKLINLHLEVIENTGDIIFLKKVVEGVAGNSYGLHVAKLAGIPGSVLLRASSILSGINTLKNDSIDVSPAGTKSAQPSLFTQNDILESTIKSLDLNNITPMAALQLLYDLRSEIEVKT
ncbi:MAG: DNA mismatch repair protein MutS [Spirochaetia bacterium]|jgi:DNA mismatch repair protein MutS|nr:DNA mismatch repair protein MutS [Spirochaetia bacterium]